jgi:hypothetical protein
MGVDRIAGRPGNLRGGGSHAAALDLGRAPAPVADHVVMVGRLARDVRVSPGRQVDPFHQPEIDEQIQRPKDGRPTDVQPAPPCIADQVVRGEMAGPIGYQPGDRSAGLGQAIAGAVDDVHEFLRSNHGADDTGSQLARREHGRRPLHLIFNQTGGSLIVVILLHASVNLGSFVPAAVGSTGAASFLYALITLVVASAVVLRHGRRALASRPRVTVGDEV